MLFFYSTHELYLSTGALEAEAAARQRWGAGGAGVVHWSAPHVAGRVEPTVCVGHGALPRRFTGPDLQKVAKCSESAEVIYHDPG